jgi:hypothetical protein
VATKLCQFCRSSVAWDATVCPKCRRDIDSIEDIKARLARDAAGKRRVYWTLAGIAALLYFISNVNSPNKSTSAPSATTASAVPPSAAATTKESTSTAPTNNASRQDFPVKTEPTATTHAELAAAPPVDRLLILRNWSDPPGLIRLPRGEEVTYEQVARNPVDYFNSVITMSGKIVQTIEENGIGFLRIDVVPLDTASPRRSDIILVEYPIDRSVARLLDGDSVRFAARFLGIRSYKTVLGAAVQVPYFKCLYTPKLL